MTNKDYYSELSHKLDIKHFWTGFYRLLNTYSKMFLSLLTTIINATWYLSIIQLQVHIHTQYIFFVNNLKLANDAL